MNPCIQAELAYFMARGGLIVPLNGGFAVENLIVQETGDYNAFFANTYSDVAAIRQEAERRLSAMNYSGEYEIHVLDGQVPQAVEHEINSHWVSEGAEAGSTNLRRAKPAPAAYWQWYEAKVRAYEDFDEPWWDREQVSHDIFLSYFEPIWYWLEDAVVGRLYRLAGGPFVRLFSIVVEPEFRGRGYGTEMVTREVAGSDVPVHIRAGENLRDFYAKAGFEVRHRVAKVRYSL